MRQCGRGAATRAGWAQVDVVPDHPCCLLSAARVRACACARTKRDPQAQGRNTPTDRHDSVIPFVTRLLLSESVCFGVYPLSLCFLGAYRSSVGCVSSRLSWGAPLSSVNSVPALSPLPVSVVSLSKPQLVPSCTVWDSVTTWVLQNPSTSASLSTTDVTTGMLLNQLRTLAECGTRRESSRSVTTSRRQLVARGWVGFPLSQDLRPPYTAVALKGG